MNTSKLSPIAKSIAAFIVGLSTIIALFINLSADGSISGSDVSTLVIAVIGALTGTGAVYQVKNTKQEVRL